jgi:hypothetical protein
MKTVVEFVFTCKNLPAMTKEEFLSRQSSAEHRLNSRNQFADWFSYMVIISMFIAVPYLTGIFLWALYKGFLSYGLLGEIGFCLLVLAILWVWMESKHRKTVAYLKQLGLRCRACDRSPIFDKGKITAETGKCWHCGESFFDVAS